MIKKEVLDKALKLDKNALDKEWEDHAEVFYQVSQMVSLLTKERDALKDELAVLEAELDKDIRANPKDFGLTKITEGAVVAAISTEDEVIEIKAKIREKNYELGIYSAGVRALEHKKKALESLVSLWISGYYSDPKIPADAREKSQSGDRRRVAEHRETKKGKK